jgi:hypothetical protein
MTASGEFLMAVDTPLRAQLNGAIYTCAYRGSHTGMQIELASLGITFKHGKPYHPADSRGPRNSSGSQRDSL